MTDLEWVIEQTVKHQRGLSKELAVMLGVSQSTLLGKVDSNNEGKHLSVIEAHRIMQHTGDVRILEEQARELGYRLIKAEHSEALPILDALLNAQAEHGDIARVFGECNKDGVLTVTQERKIIEEIRQSITSQESLIPAVQAYAKSSRGEC